MLKAYRIGYIVAMSGFGVFALLFAALVVTNLISGHPNTVTVLNELIIAVSIVTAITAFGSVTISWHLSKKDLEVRN
jgi:hypothetical protein